MSGLLKIFLLSLRDIISSFMKHTQTKLLNHMPTFNFIKCISKFLLLVRIVTLIHHRPMFTWVDYTWILYCPRQKIWIQFRDTYTMAHPWMELNKYGSLEYGWQTRRFLILLPVTVCSGLHILPSPNMALSGICHNNCITLLATMDYYQWINTHIWMYHQAHIHPFKQIKWYMCLRAIGLSHSSPIFSIPCMTCSKALLLNI